MKRAKTGGRGKDPVRRQFFGKEKNGKVQCSVCQNYVAKALVLAASISCRDSLKAAAKVRSHRNAKMLPVLLKQGSKFTIRKLEEAFLVSAQGKSFSCGGAQSTSKSNSGKASVLRNAVEVRCD